MDILIKIRNDEAMKGYQRYSIELTNTLYQDRDKLKELKFCWDRESKVWSQSGSIATTKERTAKYLMSKLNGKGLTGKVEMIYG